MRPQICATLLASVARAYTPPIQISEEPRIYIIDGFATADECAEIFNSAEPRLEQSMTYDAAGSKEGATPQGRQSRQYTLPPSSWSENVTSVVARMDAATLLPHENGQHLTVTEYSIGDHYETHVDSNLEVGRVATALLFLEAPAAGGELIFPWARGVNHSTAPPPDGVHGTGRDVLSTFYEPATLPRLSDAGMCAAPSEALRIEPRVGRLAIFFNHDPMMRTLRPRSLHGSCAVRAGRKRIAQRWYQWHALNEPNHLHTALERAFGSKVASGGPGAAASKWRVDYQAQLRAADARRAAAVRPDDGTCVDRGGPWECTERGCPKPRLGCADLAELGGCELVFDDVWAEAPEGTAGLRVDAVCKRSCGACKDEL